MRILSLLFVAIALAGTAWGQSKAPATLSELAKYNRADRDKILYEGAKREGKVVWYTSLVPSKDIAKIFEAKYPGVAVEVYRAGGIELLNKALSEYKARRYIVDTVESTPGALMSLRDEKFFVPYHSPHLKAIPTEPKKKPPEAWCIGPRTGSRISAWRTIKMPLNQWTCRKNSPIS